MILRLSCMTFTPPMVVKVSEIPSARQRRSYDLLKKKNVDGMIIVGEYRLPDEKRKHVGKNP